MTNQERVEVIRKVIHEQTDPANVSPSDAIEILEEVDADLYGMIEALKEENG